MILAHGHHGGIGLGDVAAIAAESDAFFTGIQLYKTQNVATSIGLRLEFWKKSLGFFAEAPSSDTVRVRLLAYSRGSHRQYRQR
jgi:hypothetical protein